MVISIQSLFILNAPEAVIWKKGKMLLIGFRGPQANQPCDCLCKRFDLGSLEPAEIKPSAHIKSKAIRYQQHSIVWGYVNGCHLYPRPRVRRIHTPRISGSGQAVVVLRSW